MINRVILTGRLTDNPQIRHTQTSKVASFSIAVNRRFAQPNQPQADFIRCVAFGKLAELLERYVTKGTMIGVEGRIQTGSYDDPNTGRKVYTTDIVCDNIQFLESKRTQNNEYQNQQFGYQSPSNQEVDYTSEANFAGNEQNFESDFKSESLEIASDDLPF